MRLTFIAALIWAGLYLPATAQEGSQARGDEIVENWGRVKYCRAAYDHPDNKTRVYQHDIDTCNAANTRMRDQTLSFNEASRANIERAAEQRSRVIMQGTRDIAWVLNSCREACTKISAESKKAAQP